jgi:glycosyltransferase involved in cell wall biosynthesis
VKPNVVLYVGAFELPDRNAAAQRVRANATLLTSLGYKVVLVGRNSQAGFPYDKLQKSNYPEIEQECWEMGYPANKGEWLRYISSSRFLNELVAERYNGQLHSILCYNYPAIAQLSIRNLARRSGAMALADVTEWYQTVQVTGIVPLIKNLDTGFRMHVVNFSMDGLITTSRYLTRFYKSMAGNLVELPTLIDMDQEPSAFASPDGAPKRIFFAGAIEDKRAVSKVKGGLKDHLDWVIEILYQVHLNSGAFQFDIYGVERKAYIDSFESHAKLIESMGAKVVFHGRKPRNTLLESLKKADFSMFLRPNIRTTNAGFPTKFSESISYGVPVITNKLDCLEPYVEDGKNCILIDHDDIETSVARVLQALIMKQAQVLAMSEHCLKSRQFHPISFRDEAQKLFPPIERDF